MSETFCLQWNEFKPNAFSMLSSARENKEYVDLTLACEDGQQMEAHRVILASSSPFFENILQKNKHPHPLIYFANFKSHDMDALLEFVYLGEAKVDQENLGSFLALAEHIKLKGLTGETFSIETEQDEKPLNLKPDETKKSLLWQTTSNVTESVGQNIEKLSIPCIDSTDVKALGLQVNSMMERTQKMIPNGRQPNGTIRQATAFICKVCGKEDNSLNMRRHIEANHLQGISLPCNHCDKVFSSRLSLSGHKRLFHTKK